MTFERQVNSWPVGLQRPRTVTLAVTETCNLGCAHCWVESSRAEGKAARPASDLRRLIREFRDLGCDGAVLTGGEPLTHPEWSEVLTWCCRSAGLRTVTVQTNGTLIGEAEVRLLKKLAFPGLVLQVSLEGARPETHDRIRGEGAFELTREGLRRLAAADLGAQVQIAFTETRSNLEELPEVLALAETLGAGGVTSGFLVPRGRAEKTGLEPPVADQYRALAKRYRQDGEFRVRCERFGAPAAVAWLRSEPHADPHACTFLEHPYVTSDGHLLPCVMLRAEEMAADGVYRRPLAEVIAEAAPRWVSLRELGRRRSASLPACLACPARGHCMGGCLGRAYAAAGKPWAVEDRCALRLAIWRERLGDGPPSTSQEGT